MELVAKNEFSLLISSDRDLGSKTWKLLRKISPVDASGLRWKGFDGKGEFCAWNEIVNKRCMRDER